MGFVVTAACGLQPAVSRMHDASLSYGSLAVIFKILIYTTAYMCITVHIGVTQEHLKTEGTRYDYSKRLQSSPIPPGCRQFGSAHGAASGICAGCAKARRHIVDRSRGRLNRRHARSAHFQLPLLGGGVRDDFQHAGRGSRAGERVAPRAGEILGRQRRRQALGVRPGRGGNLS